MNNNDFENSVQPGDTVTMDEEMGTVLSVHPEVDYGTPIEIRFNDGTVLIVTPSMSKSIFSIA